MTEYILPRGDAEAIERERLTLLERRSDPFSARQLDAIGVGQGWRCLDVGAGAGSVTRMLAERVGETGSVLATDLDPRLLEPLASDRVEVRRHDLLMDPLPEAAFDLVHVRFVLVHLPARLEALRRLVTAVRPGGWVAAHDVDFGSVGVSPASAAWDRAWSAFFDATVAAGLDPNYGARLYASLEAVGLEGVEAEQVVHRHPGGSQHARLLVLTLERLRPRLVAFGATDADVDEAQRLLEDPAARFRTPTAVLAHGRRPAGWA
jgi:SAM-dependent methyltransferase